MIPNSKIVRHYLYLILNFKIISKQTFATAKKLKQGEWLDTKSMYKNQYLFQSKTNSKPLLQTISKQLQNITVCSECHS